MWPVILAAEYAVLPVAMVVGFVGYNYENWMHKNVEKKTKSLVEERADRNLDTLQNDDPTRVTTLKGKSFVPESSLEVNKVRES